MNGEAKTRIPSIGRLKRRAEFLRAAKGRRWHGKAFSLQAASPADPSPGDPKAGPRVGFTVTKKVGNSIVRNRARRRLREALRITPGLSVEPGRDYVIIARIEAVRLPFSALQKELSRAIRNVQGEPRPRDAAKRVHEERPTEELTDSRPTHGIQDALSSQGPPPGVKRTRPRL